MRSSCATEILNPVLYSTFKFIFSQNKEITKNFLNSLIFNEEKQIKELEYVRSKLPMIKEDKYGKNIKRTNVVLICNLGRKVNEERISSLNKNQKNNSRLLIDIEMQTGDFEQDYSERFIDYVNQIYANEKVDKAYVIVLVLNPKKSTEVKSKNSKNNQKISAINEYDFINIIKIDLNYCYKILDENKGILISNSNKILNRYGEEWIKYFTIPLWCYLSDKGYYLFPNLYEDNFIKNEYVLKALSILLNKNNYALKDYHNELALYEKERKIYEAKEKLSNAQEELSNAQEELSKVKEQLLEKEEEIQSLNKEYNKIKKECMKLKKTKLITKSPKVKSSKAPKKKNKSSNIKKKK